MDRLRFVTHRGQRILLMDLTDCTAEEVALVADRTPPIVTQEPKGSLLIVTDFSGAHFDRNAVERIKIAAAIDRPYIKRSAWVLAENLPKALYESIRSFSAREFPIFATRDEALDHVTS